MAKGQTNRDFAEQTTERAIRMESDGMDWMRVIAEESLNLGKAAFEGYLTTARKTAENMNRQASEFHEQSTSLAHEAIANAFDFATRVVRVKKPQEVLQVHSEFLSRQAQTLADKTNELRQTVARSVNFAATTAEQMGRAAE
jgi:hypothetical protein